jgi:glycosyltransferase involved in cell wall biosynthesis
MESGLVSIITPIFNGDKYIAETIESVINQSYTQWEMLIIDDGSTDRSADIIKGYLSVEKRIFYFFQQNGGSASARNNGIRNANGQYFALLDADDIWERDFLKSQISLLKEKKAVLVYASYKRINETSEEILKPLIAKPFVTYKHMLRTNYIGCLTGLYDRTKYGKIFLKEELKSIRDDYAYWLDIVKLSGIAFGNQQILASYRVIKSSTTGKKKKLLYAQFAFYNKYLGLNLFRSLFNTIYWGILGIVKFYNNKK